MSKKTTVSEAIAKFLDWIKMNRSENTFKMYSGRLKALGTQLGAKKLKDVELKDIDRYLQRVNKWPNGADKAPDTVRANIVAGEQLEKFCMKAGIAKRKFWGDHEKPIGRERDRLPTPEEVEKIKALSSQEFNRAYQALRQSCARPNELARATVADWDQANQVIILVKHKTAKKTGRPRKITVGEKLRALILESLDGRTEGPLFLTPRGKQWTTESLSSAFRRARNKAKLDRQIVLYTARHEHATAIYRQFGRDAAMDALGHSSGVTDRYCHRDANQLRANQDSVSL